MAETNDQEQELRGACSLGAAVRLLDPQDVGGYGCNTATRISMITVFQASRDVKGGSGYDVPRPAGGWTVDESSLVPSDKALRAAVGSRGKAASDDLSPTDVLGTDEGMIWMEPGARTLLIVMRNW